MQLTLDKSNTQTQWSLTKRPQKLDDVHGQEVVQKYFKKAAKTGKYPEATLFQGQYGTGKTTTAMIVAAMMNCHNPDADGNPCCECESCKDIFGGKFKRDVVMIDGGQSSKDDIIEKVSDFIKTPAMKDNRKIMIIEEVQELSQKAKNSMLKVLETLRPNIHFFFTAMEDVKKSGFLSRCQAFTIKSANFMDMMYFLRGTLEKEGLWEKVPQEFQMEGLKVITTIADGSYRHGLQILQQCIESETYTVKEIQDAFGVLSDETYLNLILKMLDGNIDDIVKETILDRDHQQDTYTNLYRLASGAYINKTFKGIGEVEKFNPYAHMCSTIAAHKNFDMFLSSLRSIPTDPYGKLIMKPTFTMTMCDFINKVREQTQVSEGVTPAQATAPTQPPVRATRQVLRG